MSRTRRPSPSKTTAETRRLLAALVTLHPAADTQLRHSSAYELLVATILSAQCTDARVNEVTPSVFARYPDAAALAAASAPELQRLIRSTGFFRAKARALIGMASVVVQRHGGSIPPRLEDLVVLPGIGRKTANVVLGHAFGVPALPVDRHVLRVANRIGIARSANPEEVEAQLCAALPARRWTVSSDTLILHGRRICKPRPLCDQCTIQHACDHRHAERSAHRAARRIRPQARASSRTTRR